MEQFAGYTARTRPDTDREQHDVHHPEPRHGKRAQEHAGFGIVLAYGVCIGDLRFEADPADGCNKLFCVELPVVPDGDTLGGKVDACSLDTVDLL